MGLPHPLDCQASLRCREDGHHQGPDQADQLDLRFCGCIGVLSGNSAGYEPDSGQAGVIQYSLQLC